MARAWINKLPDGRTEVRWLDPDDNSRRRRFDRGRKGG